MYANSNTTNAAVVLAQAAVSTSKPVFVAEHLNNFKFEASSQRNCSSDTRLCLQTPLIHIYNDY